ncbi:MAG: hypothetical protein E4H17_03880 [Gemmatimonadales bacterium]|nr:MAG: hypothetical protein E4H17_03880 [Gemmatimonadales bacterium]
MSAALRLFTALATVTIVVSGILAALVNRLFDLPPELVNDARLVVLLSGAAVAAAFIGGVFSGVVTGLQRFDIDGTVEIIMTALRATAVVVALRLGYGLVALGAIQLGISLLRGGIAWAIAHRLYPGLSTRERQPPSGVLRRLLAFSLFSSLIQWSGMLIYYSDSLVIATFLPVSMVTYFVIAGSLVDYARQVVGSLTRIITPRASEAAAAGGAKAASAVFLAAAPLATLITVPIAITFLLRGARFISLWMGPDYASTSAPVLWILAATVWLVGGRGVATATLMGLNRHRGLAVAFVAEAAVNLGLSIALVERFGIVGVALGTAVPSTLVAILVMPALLARHLQIPVRTTLVRVWLLPSLACLAFAAGSYGFESWAPPSSLLVFMIQVAVLLPLVPAGAWFLVFSREERDLLSSRVKSVAATISPPLARRLRRQALTHPTQRK